MNNEDFEVLDDLSAHANLPKVILNIPNLINKNSNIEKIDKNKTVEYRYSNINNILKESSVTPIKKIKIKTNKNNKIKPALLSNQKNNNLTRNNNEFYNKNNLFSPLKEKSISITNRKRNKKNSVQFGYKFKNIMKIKNEFLNGKNYNIQNKTINSDYKRNSVQIKIENNKFNKNKQENLNSKNKNKVNIHVSIKEEKSEENLEVKNNVLRSKKRPLNKSLEERNIKKKKLNLEKNDVKKNVELSSSNIKRNKNSSVIKTTINIKKENINERYLLEKNPKRNIELESINNNSINKALNLKKNNVINTENNKKEKKNILLKSAKCHYNFSKKNENKDKNIIKGNNKNNENIKKMINNKNTQENKNKINNFIISGKKNNKIKDNKKIENNKIVKDKKNENNITILKEVKEKENKIKTENKKDGNKKEIKIENNNKKENKNKIETKYKLGTKNEIIKENKNENKIETVIENKTEDKNENKEVNNKIENKKENENKIENGNKKETIIEKENKMENNINNEIGNENKIEINIENEGENETHFKKENKIESNIENDNKIENNNIENENDNKKEKNENKIENDLDNKNKNKIRNENNIENENKNENVLENGNKNEIKNKNEIENKLDNKKENENIHENNKKNSNRRLTLVSDEILENVFSENDEENEENDNQIYILQEKKENKRKKENKENKEKEENEEKEEKKENDNKINTLQENKGNEENKKKFDEIAKKFSADIDQNLKLKLESPNIKDYSKLNRIESHEIRTTRTVKIKLKTFKCNKVTSTEKDNPDNNKIETLSQDLITNENIINSFKTHYAQSKPGKSEGKTKTNQDTYIVLTNINAVKNYNIFGVLDGHGLQGHLISQFVSKFIQLKFQTIPEITKLKTVELIYEKLISNNYEIIKDIFINANNALRDEEMDAKNSGTTCVLVIQLGEHIICANTGDSRAIIVFDEKNDSNLEFAKVSPLSFDTKPENPNEKERILRMGGIVEKIKNKFGDYVGPYRVFEKNKDYPGLAMSRSIGDFAGKKIGVIPDPEIIEWKLTVHSKFIVICSDGVWEFMSNKDVMEMGKKFYLKNNPREFCKELIEHSVKFWEKEDIVVDDITVVTVFF